MMVTLFLGLSLSDALYYVANTFFQVPNERFSNNIKNFLVYWYVLTTYGNAIQLLCVLDPHFWITFLWCVCVTY